MSRLSVSSLTCLVLSILSLPAWCGGSVSGTVIYQGEIPVVKRQPVLINEDVCGTEGISENFILGKRGALKNAVVFIQGPVKGARKPQVPEGGYIVDQKQCRFDPHVVVVPAGIPLQVMNSDPILHNFHSYGRTNPPQIKAQLKSSPPLLVSFDHPEIFEVKCDVHPWMSLWVVVSENPYYMVTGDNGTYRLQDIPAGDYNLVVWHETLGTKIHKIRVQEGEDLRLDMKLEQKK